MTEQQFTGYTDEDGAAMATVFQVDISGAKFFDPETGASYWWPDDDAPPADQLPLGPEWKNVGYTDAAALDIPTNDE